MAPATTDSRYNGMTDTVVVGIRPEPFLVFVAGMKRLGVFILPPGWDASSSEGYPQQCIHRYPFIHLGGGRHYKSKLSGQGSNPDRPIRSPAHLKHKAIAPSMHVTLVVPKNNFIVFTLEKGDTMNFCSLLLTICQNTLLE